ncbi:MAG: hypothetical protein OD814_000371 [Candidatus Alkanophagales archaeon MCA70_species_1]|nr:hypothetical protein [Candidatus Alkanophaga volatiphilum]
MGVHRITSPAARAYAAREKVIGKGITVLGEASEKVTSLSKKHLEELGDVAAELVPHSPGYAGKILQIVARLFWALAGVPEKEAEVVDVEALDEKLDKLHKIIQEA